MNCPACGAAVRDPDARFCPRCGSSLGSDEGLVTDSLQEAPAAGSSSTAETSRPPGEPNPSGDGSGWSGGDATALASDMVLALRRSLVSGGWVAAAQVAGFGWLAMLGFGALFAAVIKLADPTFGSGESALWVLEWVVLLGGLGIGVPIEDNLSVSVLPLGSLLLIGWAIVWASRRVVSQSSADSRGARMVEGAKAGLPLGVLCLLSALIFRIDNAAAAPGSALLLGALWGGLFGAVGGLLAHGSMREALAHLLALAGTRSMALADGIAAGAIMLAGSAVLGAAAALLGLIVWLATGDASLEAGEAVLLVFLLVAFAPNVVAGVVGFGLGAPIVFAGDFGFGGGGEYSLLGWGSDGAEPYMYVALLIPAAGCLFGGYVARRRARVDSKPMEIVGVAAGLYALVLAVVVSLGDLDIGGDVTGSTVFELGLDVGGVFVLGLAWAAAVGYLGWKLGESTPTAPKEPAVHRDPRAG